MTHPKLDVLTTLIGEAIWEAPAEHRLVLIEAIEGALANLETVSTYMPTLRAASPLAAHVIPAIVTACRLADAHQTEEAIDGRS